jgi:hypothetical protein
LLFIDSENSDTANQQSSHSQLFNTGTADSLKSTHYCHSRLPKADVLFKLSTLHYLSIDLTRFPAINIGFIISILQDLFQGGILALVLGAAGPLIVVMFTCNYGHYSC